MQNIILRAEALAQTVLKETDAQKRMSIEETESFSSTFTRIYKENPDSGTAHIAILNASGLVIAHTQESLRGTTISSEPIQSALPEYPAHGGGSQPHLLLSELSTESV